MRARITGTGCFLPANRVSNADLETFVNTSDEWIVQRTGIRNRYLLAEGENPSDMAVAAGQRALAAAGRPAEAVDLVLVATNFPDMICPGSAPFVAEGLGLATTPFFDLTAGCSGFVYGLAVADGLIQSRAFHCVLLIGLEALSRVTDWSDRRTCILFGDGAGATVLEPNDGPSGILGSALFGDPTKSLLLHMPAGGTRSPASAATVEAGGHFLKMEGAGVFRNAVPMMEEATHAALAQAGLSLGDVDWVIPHQANIRIVDALTERLGVDPDRVIVNLANVANTSTASIPIALDEAIRSGRVKPGDRVVVTAFGAGVTYGAVVLQI